MKDIDSQADRKGTGWSLSNFEKIQNMPAKYNITQEIFQSFKRMPYQGSENVKYVIFCNYLRGELSCDFGYFFTIEKMIRPFHLTTRYCY